MEWSEEQLGVPECSTLTVTVTMSVFHLHPALVNLLGALGLVGRRQQWSQQGAGASEYFASDWGFAHIYIERT